MKKVMSQNKETKQKGRKKLTEEQKTARNEFLANEPIADRTKRVVNPRIKRTLRDIDVLIGVVKSPRYNFTEEQKTKLLELVAERYNLLESAFNGSQKKEIKDIL